MYFVRQLLCVVLRCGALNAAAVLFSMFFTSTLLAANLTVTSLVDGGGVCPSANNCTLRQAISDANAGDQINFSVVGAITITTPLIISRDLNITGPGDAVLSVNGYHQVAPILDVSAGTVAISGLDIDGGPDAASWTYTTSGLIVRQGAKLTMTGCTIRRHYATNYGGGIGNYGSLTLVASKVLSNEVHGWAWDGRGGGIYVGTSATLALIDSTISRNRAVASEDFYQGMGGGLYLGPSSLVDISGSTIDNNQLSGSEGGGIYEDISATLQISNSTISSNYSSIYGGGLYQRETALLTLVNTTIFGNESNPFGTPLTTASGLYILGTASGTNNIVAGNSPGADIVGTLSGTKNLTNLTNLNLGPLADNGGPTRTHALRGGSAAAVGKGDAATCANAPVNGVDQRGKPRRVAGCSIGAYEAPPQSSIVPLLELMLE